MEIQTERLILRRWRPSDREPFARLNADPIVTEFLLRSLTRAESDAFIDRGESEFDERGFGRWAVEIAGRSEFIGFAGLSVPRFMPVVEVGWRIDHPYWGRGYATEAARAAVRDGFERIGLEEIVAFTVPANRRSIRVMEKLGMTHDPADDFEHPMIEEGNPLRRHVLYRTKPA